MFVSVTADTDKAVKGLQTVNQHAEKSGGFLHNAMIGALGFGGAMVALSATSQVFSAFTGGAIGMNSTLENSTLQFTTLMGNSDKAKEHVAMLFDFAAKTPYETGPIIEASRLMRTFGGQALDSKKNLTTFGDAAAATGQPINEVAFWMSRAYAAIQAGKPWGEAAQRLGEMGIVTPKTRSQLEDLQKAGAKGPAVWAALTGSLGKFDGAMTAQSQTFTGLTSTLSDGINMLLAKAFYPLFSGLKVAITWLNALMASPGFNGALESAMAAVGKVGALLGDSLGVIASVVGPLITGFTQIFGMFSSGTAITGNFGAALGTIGTTIQNAIFGAIAGVLAQIPAFSTAFFSMATSAINSFVAMAPGLITAAMAMIQNALNWVMNTGVPLAAAALGDFAVKFIDWVGPAAERLGAALPGIAGKIFTFIAANLPVIVGKLIEWGVAFIGWVGKNVLPRIPGALAAVGSAILGWIGGMIPVLFARMGELGVSMYNSLKIGVGKVVPMVGTFLGQLPGVITGWVGSLAAAAATAARGFISGFINALGSLPGKIAHEIRNAFSNIHINIGPFHISSSGVTIDLPHIDWPSFATGLWNVPSDMTANIHSGEMVVPADIAARLRGGAGFAGSGGAATSGGGSGGDVFIFDIGHFVGTEENMDRLSEKAAEAIRMAKPRRAFVTSA